MPSAGRSTQHPTLSARPPTGTSWPGHERRRAARGLPGTPPTRHRIVGWVAADLAALAVGARTPSPDAPSSRLLVVPAAPEILAVRTGRRGFVVVHQPAITHVTSLGGLVTVHADQGRYWTDLTLGEVERRLDPRPFLRLDASHVVNVTRLAELVPWTHQRYRLVFADAAKTELVMSRDVGRRLRAALGW